MYKLTLILTDEQMAERMINGYERAPSDAAIAANGCAIMRDFGAVLSFEHETLTTKVILGAQS